MTRVRLALLLTVAAVLFAIQPSASAWQDPASSNPAAAQQQPDPAAPATAMSQPQDSQTFTGKIAKSGGKLVLKDSTTKSTYALDDQEQAKRFEGQSVRVSGTLEPKTNMIRVAIIEPASS